MNKNLPNTSVQDYFSSLKINLRDIHKEAKKDEYTYTYTYANIMQDTFFFKIFSKENHHIFWVLTKSLVLQVILSIDLLW